MVCYEHGKSARTKFKVIDISNKKNVDLCKKCMSLRLPEYNMGFNKRGWENFARQKTITDNGSENKL